MNVEESAEKTSKTPGCQVRLQVFLYLVGRGEPGGVKESEVVRPHSEIPPAIWAEDAKGSLALGSQGDRRVMVEDLSRALRGLDVWFWM